MSLKYGSITHKVGKFTLIEKQLRDSWKCVVKLDKVTIATYLSLREALFRKSEWYEV